MRVRVLTLLRRQPIALLALFIALGGTSVAAVSANRADAGNVVHGCVGENTGRLRIVDSAARCGTAEMPISFNREGKRGAAGKRGAKGKAGAPGQAGAKGDAGAAGSNGTAGAKGSAGANGTAGAKGERGDNGLDGTAGAKGDRGDNGLDGTAGAKGDRGDNGLDGTAGAKGDRGDNGLDGTAGAKGDRGDNGLDGSAGAKGDNGEKGDRGDNGENGVKGDRGDNGENGAKGDKGDAGEKGEAGSLDGVEAGGALTGTFPNPLLAAGSVGTSELAAGAIDLSKLGPDIGSLVLDPPSLAAGACHRTIVPGVPQVDLGDLVLMVPINPLTAGITLEPGFVGTDDVLPVTICNNGSGTIDQGNISMRARVIARV